MALRLVTGSASFAELSNFSSSLVLGTIEVSNLFGLLAAVRCVRFLGRLKNH